MTEALMNYGLQRGVEVLKKYKWLEYDRGHNTKLIRINGKGERLYCINQQVTEQTQTTG
jgi:hypothetical protein